MDVRYSFFDFADLDFKLFTLKKSNGSELEIIMYVWLVLNCNIESSDVKFVEFCESTEGTNVIRTKTSINL